MPKSLGIVFTVEKASHVIFIHILVFETDILSLNHALKLYTQFLKIVNDSVEPYIINPLTETVIVCTNGRYSYHLSPMSSVLS